MTSPKTTTHPPAIRYETKSRIKNIETANQNLAQIIMEKRKIKGENPKKIVDQLKGRTPAPPHHRQGAQRRGERGSKAAAESPLEEGADGPLSGLRRGGSWALQLHPGPSYHGSVVDVVHGHMREHGDSVRSCCRTVPEHNGEDKSRVWSCLVSQIHP
jgi:hypothetical protein